VMSSEEARKLMVQVEQVYKESYSFHLAGIMEHALLDPQADEGGQVRTQGEIEVWFQRPRLRLDWKPRTVPPVIENEFGPQVAVLDGDYECRLSSGQWSKRKIGWYSPTLREAVGLPPAQVQYLSKDEAELFGRPMWVVRGRMPSAEATWWIDKTNRTVAKFQMEGSPEGPSSPGVPLQMRHSVVFQQVEPNAEVPDRMFEVPPDLPLDERPAGGVFADLFNSLNKNALVPNSTCPLCGQRAEHVL